MLGITDNIPDTILQELKLLNYQERLHLSRRQALDEPNSAIEHAFIKWSYDHARDKLEAGTQQ